MENHTDAALADLIAVDLSLLDRIAKEAAHLMAAIESGARFDVRDTLPELKAALDEAGYLSPYRAEDGTLGI